MATARPRKFANQIIVALTIEAVGEALLFAAKAGADPAKVRSALMGGFASSCILEVHDERILQRNFAPGFRIELHQKDLNLALQGAKALQISLPNTATCQELFNACAARGGGAWDIPAWCGALELLADYEISGAWSPNHRRRPDRPQESMRRHRKTKIVATLGPSSFSPQTTRALFLSFSS
jgi:hypothetical protein